MLYSFNSSFNVIIVLYKNRLIELFASRHLSLGIVVIIIVVFIVLNADLEQFNALTIKHG